ncbi:hypothetical protein ACA910_011495 [Epithemia clementina (nom. ined.)]
MAHSSSSLEFLWENAPRKETKPYVDSALCYSHLPNGTQILDSKWVLAKLFSSPVNNNPLVGTLETHCFRGAFGFLQFVRKILHMVPSSNSASSQMFTPIAWVKQQPPPPQATTRVMAEHDEWGQGKDDDHDNFSNENTSGKEDEEEQPVPKGEDESGTNEPESLFQAAAEKDRMIREQAESSSLCSSDPCSNADAQQTPKVWIPDLLNFSAADDDNDDEQFGLPPPTPENLWVVKDASSNGAGGIWIVNDQDPQSIADAWKAISASSTLSSHKNIRAGQSNNNKSKGNKSTYQHDDQDKDKKKHHHAAISSSCRYVAQRHVWPMVLYGGRKCHVRVYATITCDGRAFVHRLAFLHVANHPYNVMNIPTASQTSVHITNCCANSDNLECFAGEICADLLLTRRNEEPQQQPKQKSNLHQYSTNCNSGGNNNNLEGGDGKSSTGAGNVIGLGEFFPSIAATVATLAQRAMPFLDGGQANHGFEYLGLDFILSYQQQKETPETTTTSTSSSPPRFQKQPMAYLLEVNAPPSQDTATGLPHAEALHNAVLHDWLYFWVVPHVVAGVARQSHPSQHQSCYSVEKEGEPGGWVCIHHPHNHPTATTPQVSGSSTTTNSCAMPTTSSYNLQSHANHSQFKVPSKATLLNRIRWALYEQKLDKLQQQHQPDRVDALSDDVDKVAKNARRHFPYFSNQQEALTAKPGVNSRRTSTPRTPNHDSSNDYKSTHFATEFFMENAGGSQVPVQVIQRMTNSLQRRHRAVVGKASVQRAHHALYELLGASANHFDIMLGANATTLLATLASSLPLQQLHCDNRTLSSNPEAQGAIEIVIAVENHMANVTPWLRLSSDHQQCSKNDCSSCKGKTLVKWWTIMHPTTATTATSTPPNISGRTVVSSPNLNDLLGERTKIVAVSHASNILGELLDLHEIGRSVRVHAPNAVLVVDGVAAVPHVHVKLDALVDVVDYYVLSCHKVFGPHLGALFSNRKLRGEGRLHTASSISPLPVKDKSTLEIGGTVNYEACEGVVGIAEYLKHLAAEADATPMTPTISRAYSMIQLTETALARRLLEGLQLSPRVQILQSRLITSAGDEASCKHHAQRRLRQRLPLVCLVHSNWSSKDLEEICREAGFVCRSGTFLATDQMLNEVVLLRATSHCTSKQHEQEFLRFSLAHYNTLQEVEQLLDFLYSLSGWF